MDYYGALKTSEDGWRNCIALLLDGGMEDDHVKFFCFEVIEFYIKSTYNDAGPGNQDYIKQFLIKWTQIQVNSHEIHQNCSGIWFPVNNLIKNMLK